MRRTYHDRRDAGRQLAAAVEPLELVRPAVLGLPRGGVPVAFEVARALHAPLDVLCVRKLGVPWQPELGFGAIGEGGVRVLNQTLIDRIGLGAEEIERVAASEARELERRVRRYRPDRPQISVDGLDAVIVDDGLATGSTAMAAVEIVRRRGASRVVVAVPVGPPDTVRELSTAADDVVCAQTPAAMLAIGEWYADFEQTTDDEVARLLDEAARDANW